MCTHGLYRLSLRQTRVDNKQAKLAWDYTQSCASAIQWHKLKCKVINMVCGLVQGAHVNLCTVLRTAFQLTCLLSTLGQTSPQYAIMALMGPWQGRSSNDNALSCSLFWPELWVKLVTSRAWGTCDHLWSLSKTWTCTVVLRCWLIGLLVAISVLGRKWWRLFDWSADWLIAPQSLWLGVNLMIGPMKVIGGRRGL